MRNLCEYGVYEMHRAQGVHKAWVELIDTSIYRTAAKAYARSLASLGCLVFVARWSKPAARR